MSEAKASAAVRSTLEDLLALFDAGPERGAVVAGFTAPELAIHLAAWWGEALDRLRVLEGPSGRPNAARSGLLERMGIEAMLVSGRVPEAVRQEVLGRGGGPAIAPAPSDRARLVETAVDWLEWLGVERPGGLQHLRLPQTYYGSLDPVRWLRLARSIVRDLRSRAAV